MAAVAEGRYIHTVFATEIRAALGATVRVPPRTVGVRVTRGFIWYLFPPQTHSFILWNHNEDMYSARQADKIPTEHSSSILRSEVVWTIV